MEKIVRARVRISGRVQGVFFRARTRDLASRLGLDGWVMNMPDGTVEAVFEGRETDVRDAVAWCGNGPRGARVESVDVDFLEAAGESGFRVRYP